MTSAGDGAEALRLLRSSAPDTFQLVLTVSGMCWETQRNTENQLLLSLSRQASRPTNQQPAA